MSENDVLSEIKASIEAAKAQLFSEGPLVEQAEKAWEIANMAGLDLSPSELPWRIEAPELAPVTGVSVSLRGAAKEIHSNLLALGKQISGDTRLKIGIDEARLPVRQNQPGGIVPEVR